jgi:hypothetical protein
MFYFYENDFFTFGDTISFPDGEALQLEFKDTYELPFRGWYYFETEELAKEFFGLDIEK